MNELCRWHTGKSTAVESRVKCAIWSGTEPASTKYVSRNLMIA